MSYDKGCEKQYIFEGRATTFDFWKLSMSQTYRSTVGICNIVFTVSMILLAVRFWSTANDFIQALMFLGCILFPVIQPIIVYIKAKAQAAMIPVGMKLMFNDSGLHVTIGDKMEDISWKHITGIVRKTGMTIIFSDERHGYILPDRFLGDRKEEFLSYIREREITPRDAHRKEKGRKKS